MESEHLNGSASGVALAEQEALTSPFTESASTEGEAVPEAPSEAWLASPFAEAFASEGAQSETSELEALTAELEDPAFEEGIQRLVDEAAAMHLRSAASWSSESEAVDRADRELESWFESLAGEADRLLEHLEAEFGSRTPESLAEGELEAAGEAYFAEHATEHPATEQFLGGLIKKAVKLAKGVHSIVKRGISAIGNLLPMGKLFGALRRLVNPLLQRVLRTAINKLPVSLREPASLLAKKLLGELESPSEAEVAAAEFDGRLAEAVLAPNEAEADHVLREMEAEAEAPLDRYDAAGELDRARARLVDQLMDGSAGEAPTAEVEQFIPVVMAAMPLIRLGLKFVGRDKVVAFLGDRLADLVKDHIGLDMARKLGRPLADVGLRLLSLEAESGEDARLGAEALVATMEDTIREVASLPSEALAEPLRLEAEVQAAFNEAAARHIPAEALRSDLPDHEAQEAGVWVYMPRRARPAYRYKKYSRVFRVPITRPFARAIVLSDGGTLEHRLLDAGARVWPLEAEVHLYETMPGGQLGHLAAFEAEAEGPGEAGLAADEFEQLTPQIAAALTGSPGLARPRRVFRVVVPGMRVRRRHRLIVRMGPPTAPHLRVHLRLSEREAFAISHLLEKKAHARVVAMVRGTLGPHARHALGERLARHAQRSLQTTLSESRRAQLANAVAEAMLTAFAADLVPMASVLQKAAADAASGVTLSFAFRDATAASIAAGSPGKATLRIRPGLHRD